MIQLFLSRSFANITNNLNITRSNPPPQITSVCVCVCVCALGGGGGGSYKHTYADRLWYTNFILFKYITTHAQHVSFTWSSVVAFLRPLRTAAPVP